MKSLLQPLPAPAFLAVTHRADLNVLVVRWQRQTTPEELREAYFALLDAAAAVDCPYWLLDVRGRDDSNKESTYWMTDHFLPLLPTRFAGRVCLAYLFAPNHLRDIETSPVVPPLTYFDDKPYCIARFIEEAGALGWLREQQG